MDFFAFDFDWKMERIEDELEEGAKCIGPSGEEKDTLEIWLLV